MTSDGLEDVDVGRDTDVVASGLKSGPLIASWLYPADRVRALELITDVQP